MQTMIKMIIMIIIAIIITIITTILITIIEETTAIQEIIIFNMMM